MKQLLIVCALAGAAPCIAQGTGPAGVWKTIDDSTGRERSLVRIVENAGVYTGRIEKGLRPTSEEASELCTKCTGERKDKPLIGLDIIRNVKRSSNDAEVFDGGDITDPDSGKVYVVALKVLDGGNKLQVRGYIGPFYRTQIWVRANP